MWGGSEKEKECGEGILYVGFSLTRDAFQKKLSTRRVPRPYENRRLGMGMEVYGHVA